jgi:GT2 family glycosyltransferase
MIALTITTKRAMPDCFLDSVLKDPLLEVDALLNEPNLGLVPALQALYEKHKSHDILVFLHDDVEVHEAWEMRVRKEFDDPEVVIVGLGGATGIGVDDIYKTPYDIWQLQRLSYASNQRGWDIHGKQETGSRDVAVVDGFFMAIRGEFLREINGWSWFPHRFHCYDTALCLMAARRGYKVRTIGVDVTHYGGGTSITPEYVEFCKEHGTTPEREHQEPHRWLYENFRQELPLRV